MAKIVRLSVFESGKSRKYTVQYESGARRHYCEKDTLPLNVVEFIACGAASIETIHINDDFNGCVNVRTVYKR